MVVLTSCGRSPLPEPTFSGQVRHCACSMRFQLGRSIKVNSLKAPCYPDSVNATGKLSFCLRPLVGMAHHSQNGLMNRKNINSRWNFGHHLTWNRMILYRSFTQTQLASTQLVIRLLVYSPKHEGAYRPAGVRGAGSGISIGISG